jgi:phospholipid/cholesterol/gamma-HCH transport system substrate-binding protein
VETRASHVLIGTFLLLMVGALFGFVIWLARFDRSAAQEYDIFFRGSVTGLAEGAPVRFQGVPIGQVRKIALVTDDPGVVRVRALVDDDVPILRGATATLELQGLTGVAFVQIEGGFRGQPKILPEAGQDVAIIPSRPSAFQSLFQNAPQLVEQATVAVNRLGILLNETNRNNIAQTLSNFNKLSGGLAKKTPQLEQSIDSLNATMAELKTAAGSIDTLAKSARGPIADQLPKLLDETRMVMQGADMVMRDLKTTLKSGQPAVASLSDTTVPELNKLMTDLRALTRSLQVTAEKIEGGGAASLLGGDNLPEYQTSAK